MGVGRRLHATWQLEEGQVCSTSPIVGWTNNRYSQQVFLSILNLFDCWLDQHLGTLSNRWQHLSKSPTTSWTWRRGRWTTTPSSSPGRLIWTSPPLSDLQMCFDKSFDQFFFNKDVHCETFRDQLVEIAQLPFLVLARNGSIKSLTAAAQISCWHRCYNLPPFDHFSMSEISISGLEEQWKWAQILICKSESESMSKISLSAFE